MAGSGTDQTFADFGTSPELCQTLAGAAQKLGVRAEVDESNEKIGYKIRKAQMEKVPYMGIIGDKEMEDNTISIRDRVKGDLGAKEIDDFIEHVCELSETRKG